MKNLLLLCACLLALATPLRAVAGPPDIVVVRISERIGIVVATITRGEGRTEQVIFAQDTGNKKNMQGSEGYYKLYQQLYQEGYTLQNSFSAAGEYGGTYITLLFVKAP